MDDYSSFAKYADKEIEVTKNYINKLFENLDNLQDGDKIRKNIQKMQKELQFKKEAD